MTESAGSSDDEVVIVGSDGSVWPHGSAPKSDGPRRWSTASRIGVVLAMVALFAFGVVVGRATKTVTSGAATRAPGPSTSVISPTPSSGTGPSSGTATTEATAPSSGTGPSSPPRNTPDTSDKLAWPTTPDACGEPVPIPLIEAVGPLPKSVDMTVVAGGAATPVDLETGTASAPLFDSASPHYIADIATDDDGVVLLIGHCDDDDAPWHVERISADGEPIDVTPSGDGIRRNLVSGGDRVWIEMASPGAYGTGRITLLAADQSRESVTLPAGMVPVGGNGDTIICQRVSGNQPGWNFEFIDTKTGDSVGGYGSSPPIGASVMANAVADNGYLMVAPWACEDSCPLLTYHAAGAGGIEQNRVDLEPRIDHLLANPAVAISPDGGHIAVTLSEQPPSPAELDPTPPPSTGPSGTQRIGLINLDDGTIRALPGVTLGPISSPALTFSPDGKWLVAAIANGSATRLLAYRTAGDGPYDVATVSGPTNGAVLVRAKS